MWPFNYLVHCTNELTHYFICYIIRHNGANLQFLHSSDVFLDDAYVEDYDIRGGYENGIEQRIGNSSRKDNINLPVYRSQGSHKDEFPPKYSKYH